MLTLKPLDVNLIEFVSTNSFEIHNESTDVRRSLDRGHNRH
jgi:hypothetical protein